MAVITKTLKPTGGDYSLMSTWESTEQTDLVADGDSHVLECYAGTYDDAGATLEVGGWTTGASNYITIKAASGEGHGGVIGAGPIIQVGVNYNSGLLLNQDYTVIENIEINCDLINCSKPFEIAGDNITASRLILVCEPASTSRHIAHSTYADSFLMENCLLINNGTSGFLLRIESGTVTLYNNTIIGSDGTDTGLRINYGTHTLTNNVVVNCGTLDYALVGASTRSGFTNASSDGTALQTGPVTGVVLTDGVDFVEPSTGDYQPTSTGKLADAGTDLSSDFLDDITGALR